MLIAKTSRTPDLNQAMRFPQASNDVRSAVRDAASKTGVDFTYLMEKAAAESGFQSDAKANTSSATGLYQFIDQTWLTTVKAHGAMHGLGKYADDIQITGGGRAVVSDPAERKEILALRKDPHVSALMAAEFTKDNMNYLKANTSGDVGATELYLAHFLGAGGGAKFINAMDANPGASAASIFPDAASANRNVFFDSSGDPRSLKQIYDHFSKKFSGSGDSADGIVAKLMGRGNMTDGFSEQVTSDTDRPRYANTLSTYQVMALNALEMPDETDDTGRSVWSGGASAKVKAATGSGRWNASQVVGMGFKTASTN